MERVVFFLYLLPYPFLQPLFLRVAVVVSHDAIETESQPTDFDFFHPINRTPDNLHPGAQTQTRPQTTDKDQFSQMQT